MDEGYILLNRKIFSHWVHDNSEYFRAWIDLIAFSNFVDKIAVIEGESIPCKRGQSIHSVKKWAKIFGDNWSEQKVRTFFKLLQKENMIIVEGLRKTTRVTIVNYDTYNSRQRTDNEQTTNRQRTDNEQITTTELKKLKKPTELTELVKSNTLSEKSAVSCLSFDQFYSLYGYKVSRANAEKAFAKVKEDDRDLIPEAIKRYDEHLSLNKWKNKAQPASWLNGKCWLDEHKEEQRAKEEYHDDLFGSCEGITTPNDYERLLGF